MRKLMNRARQKGQALVEFALAGTLIFFLLGAAVDIGLIFFTVQELRTAAQEGATFGSYPVAFDEDENGTVDRIDFLYEEIVNRVRTSAGESTSGFANLSDMNSDGILDDGQPELFGGGAGTDPNGYVFIQNLFNEENAPDPSSATRGCATDQPKLEMRRAADRCFIKITVRYDYKLLFPLLPAFADTVPLRVSYILKVRSSFIG